MNDRQAIIEEFFSLLGRRSAARYLEIEYLVAGGFIWRIRASMAERRLARYTSALDEPAGPTFKQLYKRWNELDSIATFGKPLTEPALQKVVALNDIGIPTPVIRNWVLNGHINQDGAIVDKDSQIKILLTRVLGSAWHTLTALIVTLFLTYSWLLQGLISRKLLASLLVLLAFGLFASLMNSRSLSALPPSPELKNKVDELLNH